MWHSCELLDLSSKVKVTVISQYYLLTHKFYSLQRYIYAADVAAQNIHVLKKHENWDLTQVKVKVPWLAHPTWP